MSKFIDRLLGRNGVRGAEKDLPRASDFVFDGSVPADWPVSWWQQGYELPNKQGTAAVHAAIDAYAQTIATVPAYHWRYDEIGAKVKVTTSALSRVLQRPNDYQTRSDFFLNLVKHLLLQGNAYILGFRNDRNELTEIHQLHSRSTQPYVDEETKEVFYATGDNPMLDDYSDLKWLIPSRDVCHIRLFTPRHPLVGVSPIENAAASISANASITQSQATFYSNQSRPSGVLSTDMKLTKDQMMQLRSAWEEQAKHMNQGSIPILANGIKWNPMGVTQQDAQLVAAFQMTVEDIARAFRVPLPLVNDNRHSTYSNIEQLIAHWLSGGLGFMLDHVENSIDKFFKLPTNEKVEFEIDSLLRTDFIARVDGYSKAIQNGLLTPNEARMRFSGLPNVDYGDQCIVQQQMVPLGWTESNKQPAPPAPANEPVSPAPIDEEEARGAAVYYLKKALNDG